MIEKIEKENNPALTPIERNIVLQYLIDDNTPLTITPIKSASIKENILSSSLPLTVENALTPPNKEDKPLAYSYIFPVALKTNQVKVLKEGIILLKNAKKTLDKFLNKAVKVEFYFNKVPLYFTSIVRLVKAGFALVIPNVIYKVLETPAFPSYKIYGTVTIKNEDKLTLYNCYPHKNITLFTPPAWSIIPLSKQKEAKSYLEKFINALRKVDKEASGMHLINVAYYLTCEESSSPFYPILFINHALLILALPSSLPPLLQNAQYDLLLYFTLQATPSIKRKVEVKVNVSYTYENKEKTLHCAACNYVDLKEEDKRFLYEKSTMHLMK